MGISLLCLMPTISSCWVSWVGSLGRLGGHQQHLHRQQRVHDWCALTWLCRGRWSTERDTTVMLPPGEMLPGTSEAEAWALQGKCTKYSCGTIRLLFLLSSLSKQMIQSRMLLAHTRKKITPMCLRLVWFWAVLTVHWTGSNQTFTSGVLFLQYLTMLCSMLHPYPKQDKIPNQTKQPAPPFVSCKSSSSRLWDSSTLCQANWMDVETIPWTKENSAFLTAYKIIVSWSSEKLPFPPPKQTGYCKCDGCLGGSLSWFW